MRKQDDDQNQEVREGHEGDENSVFGVIFTSANQW